MLEVEPVDVSILAYFIGKELLIRGKEDKAKVWLKRSMLTRAPEHYYSSLAGMELYSQEKIRGLQSHRKAFHSFLVV